MASNNHLSSFSFCIAWIWENHNWVILALSLSWDCNPDLCNHLKFWLWLEDLLAKLLFHVALTLLLTLGKIVSFPCQSASHSAAWVSFSNTTWPLCEWATQESKVEVSVSFIFICPSSSFLYICPCCAAWVIPVPWPGIEPMPLAVWNHRVLTTEPPEKSLNVFYYLALATTFHHCCSTLMIAQVSPT